MEAKIAPHSERWREKGIVDRDAFLEAGAQGYLCPWADEEYGGAGIKDFRFDQIIHEENMRHGDSGFFLHLHSDLVAPYIYRIGTKEQKRRWMPSVVSGEKILAVAMTEPSTGSDLAGIRTRAEDKGDHWLLNGAKTYVSNGILADLVIVVARTDPSSKHALGLFVIERGMEGFERGKKLKKLGLQSQDTAELFFNDVRVAKENVLGDPNQGFLYLSEVLAQERLVAAIGFVATAQTAFDITLEYSKTRMAFGRPIGAFQFNRFKLAELRSELDMLQTYIDQCVLLHNAGELTALDASAAKLLASELEAKVMDACVQLHGGAGYMEEYRICRMFADARVSRIYAGTSEIMKEIVGRGLGLDERNLTS